MMTSAMQRARVVARPDARDALESWTRDSGTLAAAAAEHPDVEVLEGRGRVYVVPAPTGGGRWAVRHYQRGGAVAWVLGDRYLRVGTPRPVRELAIGRALETAGIPTPRHVGGAVYRHGLWYRGDLVTEYVPDSRDLADIVFGDATKAGGSGFDPMSAMGAAGALVRTLHEAGVVHRDLNLKNILIAGTATAPRALVIDLDRATLRTRVGEGARRRMIERFWRSARKWESRTGRVLEPVLRRGFEKGYAK